MYLDFLLEAKGRKTIEYTIDNFYIVKGFYEDYTNSKVSNNDVVNVAPSRKPLESLPDGQQYKVVGLRKTDRNNEYIALTPIEHPNLSHRVWFIPAKFVNNDQTKKQKGRGKFEYNISNYKNVSYFSEDMSNHQF